MKQSEALNQSFMGAEGHSQRNGDFFNILKRYVEPMVKESVSVICLPSFPYPFFRERVLLVVKDRL